jgi:predicted amidophosphoribosyltransferase
MIVVLEREKKLEKELHVCISCGSTYETEDGSYYNCCPKCVLEKSDTFLELMFEYDGTISKPVFDSSYYY